jgi:hypothetical protein
MDPGDLAGAWQVDDDIRRPVRLIVVVATTFKGAPVEASKYRTQLQPSMTRARAPLLPVSIRRSERQFKGYSATIR